MDEVKDTNKPRAKANLFAFCRGGVSKTKSKIRIIFLSDSALIEGNVYFCLSEKNVHGNSYSAKYKGDSNKLHRSIHRFSDNHVCCDKIFET